MSFSPALQIETVLTPSRKCILVVEDEFLIRCALSDGLRDAGYQVIEACSGDEAADILASLLPDLIISDVRMPGSQDGITLLALVRERFPTLPVIIVSGHLRPSDALADVATRFLAKPYAIEAMIEAVEVEIGMPR